MACGIRATNGVESVLQPFSIDMAEPPIAYLAPPVEAQFTAGLENRFQVRATNNLTPIDNWRFSAPDAAPWLRLEPSSFEAGTATLVGTPPAGTSGRFTFGLTPVAVGTLPVSQTFTLEVRSGPVFSSPNTSTFTVGTGATSRLPPTSARSASSARCRAASPSAAGPRAHQRDAGRGLRRAVSGDADQQRRRSRERDAGAARESPRGSDDQERQLGDVRRRHTRLLCRDDHGLPRCRWRR